MNAELQQGPCMEWCSNDVFMADRYLTFFSMFVLLIVFFIIFRNWENLTGNNRNVHACMHKLNRCKSKFNEKQNYSKSKSKK